MGQVTYIYSYTQGNKAYIGKTKTINNRKWAHGIRFDNWDYNIIDSIDSVKKEDWKPLECYWVEQFRQWGYNLENKNKGGSGRDAFRTENEIQQIRKKASKQNYYNNREKKLELARQYYHSNREKYLEQMKQWRLDNKEKTKEYQKQYQKQWYLDNKAKQLERSRQYYQLNKQK